MELAGAKGATPLNITCDGFQSKNNWSACIHGGFGTTNITINGFTLTNSNRGVELEDEASNIKVKNGYLYGIVSFEGVKNAAFSLDAHTHEGESRVSNVLFENIILNNSYALPPK
jgi:hypothetical protein